MAREAEAASWAQKRHMYAAAGAPRTKQVEMPAAGPPWPVPPTIGFPPFCRPLHVWGHPPTAVEAPLLPVWPRHLAPPPRPWAPPAMDPAAYWHHQYNVSILSHVMSCMSSSSSLSISLLALLYAINATEEDLRAGCQEMGPTGSDTRDTLSDASPTCCHGKQTQLLLDDTLV